MNWKPTLLLVLAVGTLSLAGCRLHGPSAGPSDPNLLLPEDLILDVPRSAQRARDGQFDFQSYLPLTLTLTVSGYDLRPVQIARAAGTAAPGPEKIGSPEKTFVALTTDKRRTVYMGSITGDQELRVETAVPSSVNSVLLTVSAPGYETRSMEIRNPAGISELKRQVNLGITQSSAATKVAKDADGDGVPDRYDAQPKNASVAFSMQYPPEGPFTIAFEDLYPVPGDSDFNDFVAYYSVREDVDATGKSLVISGEAVAGARAAGYDHEFGLRIGWDGPSSATYNVVRYDPITKAFEEISGTIKAAEKVIEKEKKELEKKEKEIEKEKKVIPSSGMAPEQDPWDWDHEARIVLFPYTKKAFSRPTSRVANDNGYPDRQLSVGHIVAFEIIFSNASAIQDRTVAPFDPYLYVHNTGRDIHLIDQAPFDFEAYEDKGYPLTFREEDSGFPWALLIPADQEWAHPIEVRDIHKAYPLFQQWYSSRGADAADWYNSPSPEHVVPWPDEPPEWARDRL
jgi:LruC domain-containing protein